MRGKPGKILKSIPFPRITPADAGKTYTATSYGIYNSGSPPRMRGKPVIIYAIKIQVRITPADAGKTVSIAAMIALAWDHPRGCGENTRQREQPQQLLGSPPRMRGKLSKSSKTAPSRGITPADAGKTKAALEDSSEAQDHPRGCGENPTTHIRLNYDVGSPPRMRGKLSSLGQRGGWIRITPADAGKTVRVCIR